MMSPDMLLAIAAGGSFGAVARYVLGTAIMGWVGPGFPYGTMAVNVLGSFIMGAFVESLALVWAPTPVFRAFVTVGVLGGFTTFSSFSLDAAILMEAGRGGAAAVYVVSSVLLSLGGLFSGFYLMRYAVL